MNLVILFLEWEKSTMGALHTMARMPPTTPNQSRGRSGFRIQLESDDSGAPRVERSVMAMQAYPWTLLNTTLLVHHNHIVWNIFALFSPILSFRDSQQGRLACYLG